MWKKRRLESSIGQTIGGLVLPFIQIFGLYVAFHGHLSPGGGFAGGTILGASLILIDLLDLPWKFKEAAAKVYVVLESVGVTGFALLGLAGIVFGAGFLANLSAGFPRGTPGAVVSGGFMFVLGVLIALKVASTFGTLFKALRQMGEAEPGND